MLQIKNTLGGGKPEGLYVWKKYEQSYIENIDETITSSNGSDFGSGYSTVYVGTSYSINNEGKFVLEDNVKSVNITETNMFTPTRITFETNELYCIIGASEGEAILKRTTDDDLYGYISSGILYIECSGTFQVCSTKQIRDFIDYIVSDKETAYPDGGEKGGYYYEKVVEGITPEAFGCTKMAVDEFTVTIRTQIVYARYFDVSHSLRDIPTYALIYLEGHIPETSGDIVEMYYRQAGTTYSRTETISSNGELAIINGSDYSRIASTTDTLLRLNAGVNNSSYFKYLSPGKYKVITMA